MEVRGWVSRIEAAALQIWGGDKTVLEVGTYCGLSAIMTAQTARKVYCLDHFRGDSGVGPLEGSDEARRNFKAHSVAEKIIILEGSQEDVLPHLRLDGFDVVFYDADHSEESTRRGIELLESAGLDQQVVMFHDYCPRCPGVIAAVDDFLRNTDRTICVVDTLAITEVRTCDTK